MDLFPDPNIKDICSPIILVQKTPQEILKRCGKNDHKINFALTLCVAVDLETFTKYNSSSARAQSAHQESDTTFSVGSTVVQSSHNPFYMHIEYELRPFCQKAFATDVAIFTSQFAKIYPSQGKSSELIPWSDGRNLWISWIEVVNLPITAPSLTELAETLQCENVLLRCWNGRNYCNIKTRFDRPRPPKLPPLKANQDPELIGGAIKRLVLDLSVRCEKLPTMTANAIKNLPHLLVQRLVKSIPESKASSRMSQTIQHNHNNDDNVVYMVPSNVPNVNQTYNVLTKLANMDEKVLKINKLQSLKNAQSKTPKQKKEIKTTNQIHSEQNKSTVSNKSSKSHSRTLSESSRSSRGKELSGMGSSSDSLSDINAELEADKEKRHLEIEKNGHGSLTINIARCFMKSCNHLRGIVQRMVPEDFPDESRNFSEIFVRLQLDESLLDKNLQNKLKPILVHLQEIKDLPSFPFKNFEQMSQYCQPLYCNYSFGSIMNRTTRSCHQKLKTKIDDSQIILVGNLNSNQLVQLLMENFLKIEVHDRKLIQEDEIPEPLRTKKYQRQLDNKKLQSKARLYGIDEEDENINKISPFLLTKGQNASQDLPENFGYTETRLDELLLKDRKKISFNLPLKSIIKDKNNENNELDTIEIQNKPRSECLMGNYLESGTEVKVNIEISEYLNLTDCKYNIGDTRIVLIGKDQNNLSNHLDIIYKLMGQHDSTEVTGFAFSDPINWIIVIEADISIVQRLICQIDKKSNNHLKILFNKKIILASRLYDTSIPLFEPIRIPVLLETIVKQELFYVRNLAPPIIFNTVTSLHNLIYFISTLESAIKNTSFVQIEGLHALKRAFHVSTFKSTSFSSLNKSQSKVVRVSTPLLKPRSEIKNIHKRSKSMMKLKKFEYDYEKLIRVKLTSHKRGINNYSSQTFNTFAIVQKAIEKRENKIRKSSLTRFRRNPWIYPGIKTSLNSQKTKSMECLPDQRKEDLVKIPWKEAELFSSKLKPTLPERDSKIGWISPDVFSVPSRAYQYSPLEKCAIIHRKNDTKSTKTHSPSQDSKYYLQSSSMEFIDRGLNSSCGVERMKVCSKFLLEDIPSLSVLHLADIPYEERDRLRQKYGFYPQDDIKKSLVRFQICR